MHEEKGQQEYEHRIPTLQELHEACYGTKKRGNLRDNDDYLDDDDADCYID